MGYEWNKKDGIYFDKIDKVGCGYEISKIMYDYMKEVMR